MPRKEDWASRRPTVTVLLRYGYFRKKNGVVKGFGARDSK